jgi:hypothetical protein
MNKPAQSATGWQRRERKLKEREDRARNETTSQKGGYDEPRSHGQKHLQAEQNHVKKI